MIKTRAAILECLLCPRLSLSLTLLHFHHSGGAQALLSMSNRRVLYFHTVLLVLTSSQKIMALERAPKGHES